MCCNDSSNVIRQCNNICVYYLTFVRISHIKTTLEKIAQTQIFGSCVTGNNLDFYSQSKSYHTLSTASFCQIKFCKNQH